MTTAKTSKLTIGMVVKIANQLVNDVVVLLSEKYAYLEREGKVDLSDVNMELTSTGSMAEDIVLGQRVRRDLSRDKMLTQAEKAVRTYNGS